MKQNTFKSTLALVAIFALTACSSDELPADPSFDQDIKTELVDKSQLPEWLADYVSYLEYVPEALSCLRNSIMKFFLQIRAQFIQICTQKMAFLSISSKHTLHRLSIVPRIGLSFIC